MVISAIRNTISGSYHSNATENKQHANNYDYLASLNQPNDAFVRQKPLNLSFKGYNKEAAEKFIEQIEQSKVRPHDRGVQCEFYKINDEVGIKSPKPRPKYYRADFNGNNNIKEFFALKKINEISPDIAVKPHEVLNKNGKNYLAEEVINGTHPGKTKLTQNHIKDIINKIFVLDTNGIVNNNLSSENIILTGENKVKLIDFGSFSILGNDGHYINSDFRAAEQYQNGTIANLVNSSRDGKFMATFYSYYQPDYLMRSDNKFLRMNSNLVGFEYKTIYDYLKKGQENNPKELFANYLKTKSEQYHCKMADFLESLKISESDTTQFEMWKNAVEEEKIFKEVFANASENVMKAELGKIQLKWLASCDSAEQRKTFGYFQNYLDMIDGLEKNAQGAEKKYFSSLKNRISCMHFEKEEFQGRKLADNENIVKIVFENIKENTPATGGTISKKAVALLGLIGLIVAGFLYACKNQNEK